MKRKPFETREQWLEQAVKNLTDRVFKQQHIPVPLDDIKVSVGWCKGDSANSSTLGQCFSRAWSSNNKIEIFIAPTTEDPIDVLAILAHEINHAVDDCKSGHRQPFKRRCAAIGLIPEMRKRGCHTTPTVELAQELEDMATKLGVYPHAKIVLNPNKKQTTRMKKLQCENSNCDSVFRASNKVIVGITFDEETGFTICPACRQETLGCEDAEVEDV